MPGSLASLSAAQRNLLAGWLPGLRVVRDHGWGLVDNAVLEVEVGRDRYIVKADGDSNHHVLRELDAHERWLAPWVALGRAPLLAKLHTQPGRIDAAYETDENSKVLRNLDKTHRIEPSIEARIRRIIDSWPTPAVALVPTHGDWQPRNWLVEAGRVSVIDFGRASLRPALSDWLRLEARDFRDDPAREAAFVEGYGTDPREPTSWFRERLREAVNTAVWAHLVGDGSFEAQGHEMIHRVLADT